MYWWITTTAGDGRLVVLGPYFTEEEANDYAFRKFSDFEVIQLSTRDQSKATRMLKKKQFDKIGNLDIALQRAKHKLEGDTKT